MSLIEVIGRPEDKESLINILYPYDLTLEDEQDLDTLEEFETIGIQD